MAPVAAGPVLLTLVSLSVGLIGLGVLAYRLFAQPVDLPWLWILVFALLSLLVQRSGFHFASSVRHLARPPALTESDGPAASVGPAMHSLAGVIDVAAIVGLGPVPGAVVATSSGLAYPVLNALRHKALTRRWLFDMPVFNAGLKALAALAAGSLYQALGGTFPLDNLASGQLVAVMIVCLAWFALYQAGWAILDYLDGGLGRVSLLAKGGWLRALVIELLPLPFGMVITLAYAHLDWLAFALVALALVVVAVLTQRWADTRNELMRRVAELSTLEEIGRAIVQAQLDLDELCRLVYEQTRQLMDTTIFHLGLFEGDDYHIRLWMRDGRQELAAKFRLSPGEGLVSWLRETKQPILVGDFQKEGDTLPAKPVYISDAPPRSAVFVPLLAGSTAIGTLSIQSYRPQAYSRSDMQVLSAIANQAAVAMQKAQLYADQVRRARELETIGQVGRQATATLELDELFQRAVHLIRTNFRYYHVAVYMADPERQTISFQASSSASGQDVAVQAAWGQGLIGWVAEHCEPAIVNDVAADARYRPIDALEETQAEIAVPLLLDDPREMVGVLDVQSNLPNAFSPNDQFILETLGDQIAVAIQKARLFESGRQQAWFSTALLQVADASSRLSDMDEVLSTIVRLTPLLAGVDRCAILLWDAETETFLPTQTYGLDPDLAETFEHMIFRPGMLPALDLLRADKRPLLALASDQDLLPPDLAETFDIEEMLLLPLLAHGELLGTMMVDYAGMAYTFSERLIAMLTGIANQAAMIIHSARLVQAQQEEAYVSTVLLQVAEEVSRSINLDEILVTVVRITPLLVGVEACAILVQDPDSGNFRAAQQHGLKRSAADDFSRLRLAGDDDLVRSLAAGQTFVTIDTSDPNLAQYWRPILKDAEPAEDAGEKQLPSLAAVLQGKVLLALPLISKAELVGLMVVDYHGTEQRFTQRWLSILMGIAGQAAVAVENDRLLREMAEQERTRQELGVARRIQASFLPEGCPKLPGWELASLWRSARQVGGDFYDFVPLPPDEAMDSERPPRHSAAIEEAGQARPQPQPSGWVPAPFTPDGRLGIVVADVADKGVPAALFMVLTRTLIRTVAIDGRPPARALSRANDLILSDARSDLFVTTFYAILEPLSGQVCYTNAGHMPAIVVRAADGTATVLRSHGLALGILPEVGLPEETVFIEPADILILYTDGVVEATDAEQQMFGQERLIDIAQRHRDQTAEELVETISDEIAAFVGETAQFDDLTLVVAKRKVQDVERKA